MAQCKLCMKKGIFLSVSRNGLCKRCEPGVMLAVKRHAEIIEESNEIVAKTKNFNTKMSRYEVIRENVLNLKRYQDKGINVIRQNADAVLVEIEENKAIAVREEAEKQVTKYMDKAILAKTVTTKVNNANKALLELKKLKDEYGYEDTNKASEIINYINETQLNDFITKGDKESFKGNYKKAVDQYMEALFYLKNNRVLNHDKVKRDIEDKMKAIESNV